ncbi:MAG: repressor LexA [Candidatus Nomurabacteria bacterium]|nr:MAG: repressor LexA [Candidatus Nomurabacteria bacterium]
MKDYKTKLSSFYNQHQRMPTYSELMSLLGYKSKGAVRYLVDKLVTGDLLAKDKITGRLVPGKKFLADEKVPLLGLVEAGFPSPAEEEVQDTISFDEYLLPNKESTYILKVKGDSMIEAGIRDGDMVVVERRGGYKPGQIVVASVDGEYTLKYLRKKDNLLYLEPANKNYKPIYAKETLTVDAVVTAVVRKYL